MVHPDLIACLATGLLCVAVVECVKACARARLVDSQLARKCMHVAVGPIFFACWPLFSASGALYAAIVPLVMALKFAATGLGAPLPGAADEIRAMSRSGRRQELLRGPLLYGIAFAAATVLAFQRVSAAAALMSLCVGDGLAELVGVRFGRAWPGALPWSPRKSWAGSAAFLGGATVASLAAAAALHAWGLSAATAAELWRPLLAACAVGALVESLPMPDVDNLLVPAAVGLTLRACGVA